MSRMGRNPFEKKAAATKPAAKAAARPTRSKRKIAVSAPKPTSAQQKSKKRRAPTAKAPSPSLIKKAVEAATKLRICSRLKKIRNQFS